MAVGMRITGDIAAADVPAEVMERFADRLMGALTSKDEVVDPSIGGSLALGVLEVAFDIAVASPAEGWSRGPALLFAAVQQAGLQPLHDWTDVPGVANYGRLADRDDEDAGLRRLVSGERLLRSVRADLLPA